MSLIRDFRHCSRADYANGGKELAVVLLFAFMPAWLGIVFSIISPHGSPLAFFSLFLSSGESLLLAAGLVGPLIYIITKKYGELPARLTIHFPQGWFFTVAVFLICAIASAVYGAEKGFQSGETAETSTGKLSSNGMIGLSICILISAVGVFFLVTVLRNYLETAAPREMRSDQNDFLEEWRKR